MAMRFFNVTIAFVLSLTAHSLIKLQVPGLDVSSVEIPMHNQSEVLILGRCQQSNAYQLQLLQLDSHPLWHYSYSQFKIEALVVGQESIWFVDSQLMMTAVSLRDGQVTASIDLSASAVMNYQLFQIVTLVVDEQRSLAYMAQSVDDISSKVVTINLVQNSILSVNNFDKDIVQSIQLAPDGGLLALLRTDYGIKLIEVNNGRVRSTIKGIINDAKLIVSGEQLALALTALHLDDYQNKLGLFVIDIKQDGFLQLIKFVELSPLDIGHEIHLHQNQGKVWTAAYQAQSGLIIVQKFDVQRVMALLPGVYRVLFVTDNIFGCVDTSGELVLSSWLSSEESGQLKLYKRADTPAPSSNSQESSATGTVIVIAVLIVGIILTACAAYIIHLRRQQAVLVAKLSSSQTSGMPSSRKSSRMIHAEDSSVNGSSSGDSFDRKRQTPNLRDDSSAQEVKKPNSLIRSKSKARHDVVNNDGHADIPVPLTRSVQNSLKVSSNPMLSQVSPPSSKVKVKRTAADAETALNDALFGAFDKPTDSLSRVGVARSKSKHGVDVSESVFKSSDITVGSIRQAKNGLNGKGPIPFGVIPSQQDERPIPQVSRTDILSNSKPVTAASNDSKFNTMRGRTKSGSTKNQPDNSTLIMEAEEVEQMRPRNRSTPNLAPLIDEFVPPMPGQSYKIAPISSVQQTANTVKPIGTGSIRRQNNQAEQQQRAAAGGLFNQNQFPAPQMFNQNGSNLQIAQFVNVQDPTAFVPKTLGRRDGDAFKLAQGIASTQVLVESLFGVTPSQRPQPLSENRDTLKDSVESTLLPEDQLPTASQQSAAVKPQPGAKPTPPPKTFKPTQVSPSVLNKTSLSMEISDIKLNRTETIKALATNSDSATSTTTDHTTTFTQLQTVISNQRELAIPGFLQYKQDLDYTVRQLLAKGGSANIHMAKILSFELQNRAGNASQCVAKVLNTLTPNKEEIASFSQEIAIMWYFRSNRNFAKLLGFTNSPPTIIMKLYPRGALSDLVHSSVREGSWNSALFYNLARDIGTGLKEMHEGGFAHCDVKPANILIDEDTFGIFAVLSDFGISRIVSANSIVMVNAFQIAKVDGVSVAYAAPELLARITSDSVPSTVTKSANDQSVADAIKACDVYSFSMVCYEMISRKPPWPKNLSASEIIMKVLDGKRPPLTEDVEKLKVSDAKMNSLCQVMIQCWTHDPLARLQMKWVMEILDQVSDNTNSF